MSGEPPSPYGPNHSQDTRLGVGAPRAPPRRSPTPRAVSPVNTTDNPTLASPPFNPLRSPTPTFSYTPPQCSTPPRTGTPINTVDEGNGGGVLPAPSALPAYLTSPGGSSIGSSRRTSLTVDMDSRRESINKMASGVVKDLRKGVNIVSDNTKKASHRMKDRTVMMGTSVKGASHWVAAQTSKSAKQAMLQARSGLSIGEKATLLLTEKMSAWSHKGFTHVFMFLMIAAYTALGAALFIIIEGPHETAEKLEIELERDRLIGDLFVESRLHNRTNWIQMARKRLKPFEEQLYKSYSHGVSSDTDTKVWTFWKAMFFCSTITTTIGYGHMSPVTTAGRTLCIVYAIIGIPLMLILMADFGKLFTRILKSIFRLIGRINRSARCIKMKSGARNAGCTLFLKKAFVKLCFCRKQKEESVEENSKEDHTLEELIQDDNFNLPISLALLILIIYIIVGCAIFPMWEDWTFFEAFYFVFISISTIGFGDFVPQHPGFMMATTVYFVFGLALTAMCINIIQEKLTNTFREASLKMKQSFSHIMAKAEQEALEAAQKKAAGDTTAVEVVEVHGGVEGQPNELGG